MVLQASPSLDRVFQALASPTRRAMLRRLAAHERSVGELAEPFKMTFAGASKHIRVLEAAGLVSRRVAGRSHVFRIEAVALATADEWLRFYRRLWTGQLDALAAVLKAEDNAAANLTST